jgi:hypothetical protein
MSEDMSDLPQAETADPDGVQVALRAARTLWSRGDTAESLKWLRKAAESASDEGADLRSLQLAKAAAELRAKLFGSSEPPPHSGPLPVASGESGSHPIAQPRAESEPPRSGHSPSSLPADFATGTREGDSAPVVSSRPITATQYPSHRPRQRIGLPASAMSSAAVAAQRDGSAYAQVPSWSADAERRASSAPPPLPRARTEDYEELDAEPEDEPVHDDPASVWSSGGPESWRPAEPGIDDYDPHFAGVAGVTPPPFPSSRGAFAEDDGDFSSSEAQTVVIPPLEEREEERARHESQPAATAWREEPQTSSWDQDAGVSWASEMHAATWGNGASIDASKPEPAPPSEPARAKLTARVHHQAVRVSFAPDLRVPGQYVVRPLREGEKAATGERIALLVALEPGVPLV